MGMGIGLGGKRVLPDEFSFLSHLYSMLQTEVFNIQNKVSPPFSER